MTAAVRNAPSFRTLDQRLAALAAANNSRFKRAAMKKQLRAGADPLPLLNDPPPWLLTMKAEKFLMCLPRVGAVKAAAILRTNSISASKTVGGLSGRQRAALIAVIRELRAARPQEGPGAPTGGSGRPDPAPPASGALNA